MEEKKYWFGFKQTLPKPPGHAIVCGPYNSRDEAMRERENSKAWDCEVSIPFIAASKQEAEEIAKRYLS